MILRLPIDDVLEDLSAAMAAQDLCILVAPPGAGKTTRVPLALMDCPWLGGRKILVLEPRRLAARAAAARMAATLGESVGQRIGFRVRMETRVSAQTVIEVVTEGVFTRMLLDDPGLDGYGAVLFDEFHERSLDADLGLALARQSQLLLRDDLRLLVMSATLDVEGLRQRFPSAPVIESVGRMYPVDTRYLGRDAPARLEDQMVRAIRTAMTEQPGSLLAFLPGQAEIRRVETGLLDRGLAPDVDVFALYGSLDTQAQDRAIAPSVAGRRKVVLATSLAETSLTIEGVRIVVDSGLSRVPRFDPARGMTRLETVRVSRSSAEQRRGRAGRTEPGVCYRLWDEAETRALIGHSRPEILESDLSRLALDLALWGEKDPAQLEFLDLPPGAAFAEARTLLTALGAIDAAGDLTAHGRRMAQLPLAPRLAHMVLTAAGAGHALAACELALLLGEPGLGGRSADLATRLEALLRDRSSRARDGLALARRWSAMAGSVRAAERSAFEPGRWIAQAWPERIAIQRGQRGRFQMASGRIVQIDDGEALAGAPWIAIAELGGQSGERVFSAASLDAGVVMSDHAASISETVQLETAADGRVQARRTRTLGRIKLEDQLLERPSAKQLRVALLAQVRAGGLDLLPLADRTRALCLRCGLAAAGAGSAESPLAQAALLDDLDDWLGPLIGSRNRLSDLDPGALHQALEARLDWSQRQALDRDLPEHFTAPTGNRFAIDYAAEAGPTVSVRVQELFGLKLHPTLGTARLPLVLSLLSPAHRPIQVTRDLPGFWAGSWRDVRIEMRGRYPRHVWPDDPASAEPTSRAKPRGS